MGGIKQKPDWPPIAFEFLQQFAQTERALKQSGRVQAHKTRAEADWRILAAALGRKFFDHIRDSGQASNLISEPPRKLMRSGMHWMPQYCEPICDAEGLSAAVSQVRNNLAHGEKFTVDVRGRERDEALVKEAAWVLARAAEEDQVLSHYFQNQLV